MNNVPAVEEEVIIHDGAEDEEQAEEENVPAVEEEVIIHDGAGHFFILHQGEQVEDIFDMLLNLRNMENVGREDPPPLPPLTPRELDAIPRRVLGEDVAQFPSCPVCLVDFSPSSEVMLGPCSHPCHTPCLTRALGVRGRMGEGENINRKE